MKHLILLFIALTTFIAAADKPTYTYEGEVAGVVCSACSGHVKAALSKLDGVTDVKITLGKEGTVPHLTIISTSPNLTKEAAIKALGTQAQMYVIQSLKLAAK